MSIYIIPALFALMIKLGVLTLSTKGVSKSPLFFTMVLFFACHNVAEVLGILEFFNGERLTQVLRWYYLMTIGALGVMVLYAADISNISRKWGGANLRIFNVCVITLTSALAILIMFTNALVAGSESLGYIMTSVRGPAYLLFPLFAILSFCLVVSLLVYGYKNAESHRDEISSAYTLLALAPVVIASFVLMGLMVFGVRINATAVLPITTALFLVIMLKTERQHRIIDIRRHIPYSLERKTSAQIMEIFSKYASDEVNYRDGLAEIEKLLVLHKHDKHRGNVSSTASSMEIPRSSLYSIFRRLDIELKESKQ